MDDERLSDAEISEMADKVNGSSPQAWVQIEAWKFRVLTEEVLRRRQARRATPHRLG